MGDIELANFIKNSLDHMGVFDDADELVYDKFSYEGEDEARKMVAEINTAINFANDHLNTKYVAISEEKFQEYIKR